MRVELRDQVTASIPASEELRGKSKWIPIREMVSPDTIGSSLVESIEGLGERLRPKTIFNQPIDPLINQHLRNFRRRFEGQRVKDILNRPKGELKGLLKKLMENYVEGLSLTPHAKLLEQISGQKQYPVSPEHESQLVNSGAVEKAINQMTVEQAEVIELSFGIKNGICLSDKMIADKLNLTIPKTRRTRASALKELHKYFSFKNYLTDSHQGNLPEIGPSGIGEMPLGLLDLKPKTRDALLRKGIAKIKDVPENLSGIRGLGKAGRKDLLTKLLSFLK